MNKTEALAELSMAVDDLASLAETIEGEEHRADYRLAEAFDVLAEPETFAVNLADLRSAVAFWDKLADENGWTVASMTVWVRADGTVEDSVGISEGTGLFLVPSGKE